MSRNDWYRNTKWNDPIESEFEARLKRTRGNYHKAQYLRIQATYLLDSTNEKNQNKGVELMERLIEVYPEEKSGTIFANEQLGDFFFKKASFEKAEKYYRIVTNYYHTETRSGTTGLADLKLCETILRTGQIDKINEAYELATDKFKVTGGRLTLIVINSIMLT